MTETALAHMLEALTNRVFELEERTLKARESRIEILEGLSKETENIRTRLERLEETSTRQTAIDAMMGKG